MARPRAAISSHSRAGASRAARSAVMTCTRRPYCRSRRSARARSRSSRRAVITRSHPAAANTLANASPIPLDAPVTRTVRVITFESMKKLVVSAAVLAALAGAAAQSRRSAPVEPFTVVEASIDAMRRALDERRTTSRDIVQQYLTRIALYEDRLNAVLYVNPNALAEAEVLDRERRQGRIRGPLHGIPIALKDNIH